MKGAVIGNGGHYLGKLLQSFCFQRSTFKEHDPQFRKPSRPLCGSLVWRMEVHEYGTTGSVKERRAPISSFNGARIMLTHPAFTCQGDLLPTE